MLKVTVDPSKGYSAPEFPCLMENVEDPNYIVLATEANRDHSRCFKGVVVSSTNDQVGLYAERFVTSAFKPFNGGILLENSHVY